MYKVGQIVKILLPDETDDGKAYVHSKITGPKKHCGFPLQDVKVSHPNEMDLMSWYDCPNGNWSIIKDVIKYNRRKDILHLK